MITDNIKQLKHFGMCDASAAIPIGSGKFVVANDEDNLLKVFEAQESGKYITAVDISGYFSSGSGSVELPETDIEGAAAIGETIFWITSHGRNRKAKRFDSRYFFFANKMQLTDSGVYHELVGNPYPNLFEDMLADDRLQKYQLAKAEKLPPKAKGGLNVEGLGSSRDNHLLIGFRNPIPDGKALLLPILNPFEVISGNRAHFGDPVALDLNGLGIRSIEYWPAKDVYIIVAGPYYSGGKFRLYQWSGNPEELPALVEWVDLTGLNVESIVVYPEYDHKIQLLSDDGNALRLDKKCKKLPDDDEGKYFRSIWVTV